MIPVLLDSGLDLPPTLAARQWVDLSGHRTNEGLKKAAVQIAEATASYLKTERPQKGVVSTTEAPFIAAEIANQVRASGEPAPDHQTQSSVFVVHGHDVQSLTRLETYLSKVGIVPIVLSRQDSSPQSLFQKFMSVATQARFAIVLLGADDYGASRKQYEAKGVADRALQFRARQNVILELGFFYGRLGWENVFVVYQEPDQVFPNFERPSDLDGVVFDSFSEHNWEKKLGARLAAAGFPVAAAPLNSIDRWPMSVLLDSQ